MRVSVVGTSGSGKTTFAAALAEALGVPHIDLDAVNWQAGWRDLNTHDPAEFVRRVGARAADDAWMSCGNYATVRPAILGRATHLIWLDYDRRTVMARVIRRSFARAWTKAELWPGTGNREEFRRWLDKEHPIRWAWDTFESRRQRYEEMWADPALAGLEKHRLQRPADAAPLIRRLAATAAPTPVSNDASGRSRVR